MSGAKLEEKFCKDDEREEEKTEYAEMDGEKINTSEEEDDSFGLLDWNCMESYQGVQEPKKNGGSPCS